MTMTRKRFYLSGVAVATVAALATWGTVVLTSPAAAVPRAARTLTAEQLHALLPDRTAYPAGTELMEVTLDQAARDGMLGMGPDVVVKPASCTGLFTRATGATAPTGWVSIATGAAAKAGRPDISVRMVANVPGGASLDRIREAVASCRSGTITMTRFGVVGTYTLREFPVPQVQGGQSLGVVRQATFPANVSAEASKAIHEGPLTTYSTFTVAGNLVMELCEPTRTITSSRLTSVTAEKLAAAAF